MSDPCGGVCASNRMAKPLKTKPFIIKAIASAASFEEMRVFMYVSWSVAKGTRELPPPIAKQEPCQPAEALNQRFAAGFMDSVEEPADEPAADTVRGQRGHHRNC